MGRWFLIVILGIFCWCVPSTFAGEVAPEFDQSQPIEITSQQLEVLQQQRQSIFTGDVVVKQGEMTLSADKLIVVLKKDQDLVERLEAVGAVKVIQLDRIATAEKAVFYQLEEKLVLSGSAEVVQGQNKISGDEITLYMKENRSLIKSSESGRVRAVIVPEKKQEEQ